MEFVLATQECKSAERSLQELARSINFTKISYWYLVLPSVFAILSSLLLTYGCVQILGVSRIPEEPPHRIIALQASTWGAISLIGYTLSAMISTYIVLKHVGDHLYNSSIVVYYLSGGSTFDGLVQYIKSTILRASIPAPVTGLLLSLLTAGLAYPVVLCFVERAIREHATVEEEALLKTKITTNYTGVSIARDLLLTITTFGGYLVYLGYRTSKTFNTHIDIIHGTHPSPPVGIKHETTAQQGGMSASFIGGLVIASLCVYELLSYLGFFTIVYIATVVGLALSTCAQLRRGENVTRTIVFSLIVLYTLILGGFFSGIIGYPIYSIVLEALRRSAWRVYRLGAIELVLYLFVNNLVISLPSIIPYLGGLPLAFGVNNAGIIVGTLVADKSIGVLEGLSILIYPHTLLELLAYAVLVSASSYFGRWKKYFTATIIGIVVLLLAAVVETVTVILLGFHG